MFVILLELIANLHNTVVWNLKLENNKFLFIYLS